MIRQLTIEDARAATYGGLVYGAGAGGLAAGLRAAELIFEIGRPRLASVDDLDDDDQGFVSSRVGAPGGNLVLPSDRVRALELLRERIATMSAHAAISDRMIATVIGHPGAGMAQTWLHAALDPKTLVLDCGTNGRGHPSVKMGGMGLAAQSEVLITQAAVGSAAGGGPRLEVTVQGSLAATSDLVRTASAMLGGRIAACRGPFSIGFLRRAGAPGAVSASIELGHAMMAASSSGPEALVTATIDALGASVVGEGVVRYNDVALSGAYDIGRVRVETASGQLDLAVCNEFMTVEREGQRLASFPDLIVALSPRDGMASAVADLQPGEPTVVVALDRSRIPLGAGVWDRESYAGVEQLLGIELADHALGTQKLQGEANV